MTKIRKFNVNISDLFEKYDKNKNKRLSTQELATALGNDMRINLTEEEIQAIKDYFKNKHNSTEIGELDFITIMNMKFSRQFDEPEAKRALLIIKQRSGKSTKMICREYDVEKIEKLTLRNFKHALHALRVLSQYQIDNLTKYLDKYDDGFIAIDVFEEALRLVHAPTQGFGGTLGHSASGNNLQHNMSIGGASSVSGKREPKWGA
jgi:Ca2+-binding EF-hand superfamily protein